MIYRIWYKIKEIPRHIKWFIQRGKRGYSEQDLWNFDFYLSNLIYNGLNDFAKSPVGYPDEYESVEKWIAKVKEVADGFYTEEIMGKANENFDGLKEIYNDLWD